MSISPLQDRQAPADSGDRVTPPSRVTPPDQATETRTGAPAYGPRSARVRYPASFWVAHCVGLMLAMGCVLGLLLGLALWRWVSSGSSSAVSGDPTQTMPAPAGYTSRQLILDDTFSGTNLDTTKWTTYLGAKGLVWNNHDTVPLPYSSPNSPGSTPNSPGSTDEAAMFGPSQVEVANGLALTAQRNTNQYAPTFPWISGVVTTEGKLSLPASGWYVQVKAKMPDMTAGMWPAIWFMPDTPTSPVPEIDLFEGGWHDSDPNQLMHADYGGGASEYSGYRDIVYDTGSNLSAGYHVYGIQYVPNVAVKYFFDGTLVFQQMESDRGGVVAGTYELLLELQVASEQTSQWHTVPTATASSASMDIAEVQAYS